MFGTYEIASSRIDYIRFLFLVSALIFLLASALVGIGAVYFPLVSNTIYAGRLVDGAITLTHLIGVSFVVGRVNFIASFNHCRCSVVPLDAMFVIILVFIKISSVLCLFSFPLFLTSKIHSAISFYYFITVIRLGSSLNLFYENLGGVNCFTFTLRMFPVMVHMVRGSVETPC